MLYQPESNRLLYSQLLAECSRGGGTSARGLSFVSKTVRRRKHWYLQLVVGPAKTQHYLGPDTEELRALMAKEKELWRRSAPERRSREQLVAMLVAGGAASVGAGEARILELLERAGIFVAGGALVGSHAFGLYANMLGVRWETETTRTADIDVAAETNLAVAIDDPPDLRAVLLESGMGFFEVPALNRKYPSTSYSIRGRQLTVDLLTPLRGKPSSAPVEIPAFGAPADPVRFLDYLLDDVQPVVVVAKAGVVANVPAPARYALHKLVTLERRPVALQTKAINDLAQARQLIEVLLADRPGDLRIARAAAGEQPPKFQTRLRQGLKKLPAPQRQSLNDLLDE